MEFTGDMGDRYIEIINEMTPEIRQIYHDHLTPDRVIGHGLMLALGMYVSEFADNLEYRVQDGDVQHVLFPGSCDCENEGDYVYCAHRIAVGVYRKAMDKLEKEEQSQSVVDVLMDSPDAPEMIMPDLNVEAIPIIDPVIDPSSKEPFLFMEAPASVNFQFINLEGKWTQWTLRSNDEIDLARRYHKFISYLHLLREEIKMEFNIVVPAKPKLCPTHSVEMTEKVDKNGVDRWFSHQLEDGSWCNVQN